MKKNGLRFVNSGGARTLEPRLGATAKTSELFDEKQEIKEFGIVSVLLTTEYTTSCKDYECSGDFSDDEIDM